jgi:hypothetical protein
MENSLLLAGRMVSFAAGQVNLAIRSTPDCAAGYRKEILRAMSSSKDLVGVLKEELKRAGMTYATLARSLRLAESSVKRMFARADMPLARIDEICAVLKLDFAELARQVAERQPLRNELTLEQETAVVADSRLLLMAICALSQWSLEQIVATYRIEEA